MSYRALSAAVLLIGFIAVAHSSAATLTLPASEDTFISEGAPPPGALVIGTQSATAGFAKNRALIRFDLSGIPSGAVISSASLQLTAERSPTASPTQFDIHRLLLPWSEAGSTWPLRLAPDQTWGVPGGEEGVDYASSVSSSVIVTGLGAYTFASSTGTVADVTAWITNPGTNFGWLVKQSAEEVTSPTARRFGARESAAGRPQLTIEYTALAPLRITSAGINNGQFCLQFATRSGKSYRVERKQSLSTADWSEVRTLPPAGQDGTANVCDPAVATSGFYRVVEL
jgi:hypothetical protein